MDNKPALDSALVEEFVSSAHKSIDRVIELLIKEPALVNAAWDWGGGDFETALGAASHMGRKDIAFYLLDHGARLDIFAAAMLGEIDIIKASLHAYPNIKTIEGPHGISLIDHARAGGEDAQAVVSLLAFME